MESISQTTAPSAPVSSATPTASVPDSASQFATSSPSSFQAQAPVMPQAPATSPQAAAPQASASNPWQEAFQALSASLNSPQASPAPAPYSAYQTPTPQASIQAPLASQPQAQEWASQAQQTYAPQASTPTYSAQEAAYLSQLQAEQAAQYQAAPAADSYLSQISDVSLEVLEHFGAEAPALLNNYACAVEDALIEQVGRNQSMNTMLDAASEERAAMNIMLTDPDVLADYVNGFFGPEGPFPTETAEETAVREQMEARQQFEQEIIAQEQRGVPQSFERPQMDMPTPGRQESGAGSFWGDFSTMMDNNPENAWQYLAQAGPQAFQSKMLVQDY